MNEEEADRLVLERRRARELEEQARRKTPEQKILEYVDELREEVDALQAEISSILTLLQDCGLPEMQDIPVPDGMVSGRNEHPMVKAGWVIRDSPAGYDSFREMRTYAFRMDLLFNGLIIVNGRPFNPASLIRNEDRINELIKESELFEDIKARGRPRGRREKTLFRAAHAAGNDGFPPLYNALSRDVSTLRGNRNVLRSKREYYQKFYGTRSDRQ